MLTYETIFGSFALDTNDGISCKFSQQAFLYLQNEHVLDRTVFRVGNKDYTAKQLTKKFMVPMTVPNTNQSQPEEVVERIEPKLISMTPFDADSAWVADSTTWMDPAVEADTTYK